MISPAWCIIHLAGVLHTCRRGWLRHSGRDVVAAIQRTHTRLIDRRSLLPPPHAPASRANAPPHYPWTPMLDGNLLESEFAYINICNCCLKQNFSL